MRVAIFVASESIGFYASLAEVLVDEFSAEVTFLLRDRFVKKKINDLLSVKCEQVDLEENNADVYTHRYIEGESESLIRKAVRYEERLGINVSSLISEDRGLGQGYLFNVLKIPRIIRATWSNEEKISVILKQIESMDLLLDRYDVVIDRWPDKIRSAICRSKNTHYLCLVSSRYRDRKMWSDNDYITSSKMISLVDRYTSDPSFISCGYEISYTPDAYTIKRNNLRIFGFGFVLKDILRIVFNDSKNWIRGIQKKNSYHYLGWLPATIRRVLHFMYLKEISIYPSDIGPEYNVAYMTLHLEPEVSTLSFSPEFTNSMEAISIISKCLPANYVLVVKEHPNSVGVRSKEYYKFIHNIGNVFWSALDVDSSEWLSKSALVATITGTVGVEAVLQKIPVLSFGAHQIINKLETVYHVTDFFSCKCAVDSIVSTKNLPTARSSEILKQILIESSFELEGFSEQQHRVEKMPKNIARIAITHLLESIGK